MVWVPKKGDWYWWHGNHRTHDPSDRLDQLLAEIEARGFMVGIKSFKEHDILFLVPETEEAAALTGCNVAYIAETFEAKTLTEAAAQALLWLLERGRER